MARQSWPLFINLVLSSFRVSIVSSFSLKAERRFTLAISARNLALWVDYFVRNGARSCETEDNIAEYILNIVSGDVCPGIDWVEKWNNSLERESIVVELETLS